jgi:hypothetical protein
MFWTMFSVAEARALGLPVYIRCEACMAPSRPVPLVGLDPALDLETAAASGRFRCRACGKRQGMLMPGMHRLLAERRRLRLQCTRCDKDQALTAAHAVALFGLAMPFDELRGRLACGADCSMWVGPMPAESRLSSSAREVVTLPGDADHR